MSNDPRDIRTINAIHKAWNTSAGERTVLYYAYLLSRGHNNLYALNVYPKLKDLVSLEEGTFRDIILRFHKEGILTGINAGALSPVGQPQVELLVNDDLGCAYPVPLDGLEIYDAPDSRRFKLWVEEGCDYVKQLFSNVTGIQYYEDPTSPTDDGRFLVCDTGLSSPVLVWYFMNAKRVSNIRDFEPPQSYAWNLAREREQAIRQAQNSSLNPSGLRVLSIIAAPTYSAPIANAARYGTPSRWLIGPINLAAIGYYVSKNSGLVDKYYQALLEYVDPAISPIGGIIFSKDFEAYANKRLPQLP